MIYESVRKYEGEFKTFYPYSPAADRGRWENLNLCLRKKWISLGEGYLNTDYPALTASGYMEFCNIGDRAGYESGYFERRRMLYALVMAECMEGKKRFFKQNNRWHFCHL